MSRTRPAVAGLVTLVFAALALFSPAGAVAAAALHARSRPTVPAVAPDTAGRPCLRPLVQRQPPQLAAPTHPQGPLPPAVVPTTGRYAGPGVAVAPVVAAAHHPRPGEASRLPAVRAPPLSVRSPQPA